MEHLNLKEISQSITKLAQLPVSLLTNNTTRAEILEHTNITILVLKILTYDHTKWSTVMVLLTPTPVPKCPPIGLTTGPLICPFSDLSRIHQRLLPGTWRPSGAISVVCTVID